MSSTRLSPARGRSADDADQFALGLKGLTAPALGGACRGPVEGEPAFSVAGAVAAFHAAFGLPRRPMPEIDVDPDLAELRVDLLREEVTEFADATAARDLVALADALADVVYVAYGSALSYGIDLDRVIAEVHRANMSKLDEHGQPVKRADGKVLKSPRYQPPDVEGVLQLQLPLAL